MRVRGGREGREGGREGGKERGTAVLEGHGPIPAPALELLEGQTQPLEVCLPQLLLPGPEPVPLDLQCDQRSNAFIAL
jgi:hypothetical protein